MGIIRNPGFPFDEKWLEIPPIVEVELKRKAKILELSRCPLVSGDNRIAWLLKAITCIDLTTLAGDDTEENVRRLCIKALNPINTSILKTLGIESLEIRCGAVCVYPGRVADAAKILSKSNPILPIASVATGFPTGQTSLVIRCQEIQYAVESGAKEIDIVINRRHAIGGAWNELYQELCEMRKYCGEAHMKAILAVGELPNFTFIYKASMVAMMAGADFIKTSTGKEVQNATIPFGLVMCRAIQNFFDKTGIYIGLKPAGGIRVAQDAIKWLVLIKEELGMKWLEEDLFRIGASGLLTDIEKELYFHAFHRYPPPNLLPLF